MTSRTRYAEFSGDAADLRLMLEKAKTSATRKDEHGLARMVFEGVDLTPDDAAPMSSAIRPLRGRAPFGPARPQNGKEAAPKRPPS